MELLEPPLPELEFEPPPLLPLPPDEAPAPELDAPLEPPLLDPPPLEPPPELVDPPLEEPELAPPLLAAPPPVSSSGPVRLPHATIASHPAPNATSQAVLRVAFAPIALV